jgi:hypothetical protein
VGRGIENVSAFKHGLADLALQPVLWHEIDAATDDNRKLICHVDEVEERDLRVRKEGDKDVHVAVRPEILSESRPKDSQL